MQQQIDNKIKIENIIHEIRGKWIVFDSKYKELNSKTTFIMNL